MKRFSIVFVLCALIISTIAASPPSFCKCTCFNTNSTIIALSSHSPSKKPPHKLALRASSSGCALCNRAFCLEQRLPICKNAEEKDVFTTCFQRDSRKDQIVVLSFIAATVGLLLWAAIKRIMEKRNTDTVRIADTTQYAAVRSDGR